MSAHTFWMTAVATDIAKGDRIGGIIGPSSGDNQMFTRSAIPCYPLGTTFTQEQDGPITRCTPSQPAVAWAVSLAVRSAIAPYIEQFRDGLYPAPLLAAGMTEQEIDEHRAAIAVQIGPRATIEGNGLAFIVSLGYEIIPEAE